MLGDINACVGCVYHIWSGVIGRHGVGNPSDNGLCLLYTYAEFDLTITNTLLKLRNQQRTAWMHPRSKHWHLLDYVIIRCSDMHDVYFT